MCVALVIQHVQRMRRILWPVWLYNIFMRFHKIAKSDKHLRHVCPTVRMEQLGSHWTDFHDILYLSIFWKSVDKRQFYLKSDKNNEYFTWRPIYIFFNHVSFISS